MRLSGRARAGGAKGGEGANPSAKPRRLDDGSSLVILGDCRRAFRECAGDGDVQVKALVSVKN